jgi:hypothetical protein
MLEYKLSALYVFPSVIMWHSVASKLHLHAEERIPLRLVLIPELLR